MDTRMIVLNDLARQISASLDLPATLDAIVAAAAGLIPCALAEVSLWDEATGALTLLAIRCAPDRAYPLGQSFPLGEGYTGWMVRHRQPLLVPDVDARQDVRPDLLPGEKPFRAYLGVPLMSGEVLVGTLVLVAAETGAFDADDLQVLQALGHHAANAIRNARLYEQATRRQEELSTLYAVAEAINAPLDLSEILQRVLDRVVEATGASGGAIHLSTRDPAEPVLAAQRGLPGISLPQDGGCAPTGETARRVARTGTPFLSADASTDPRLTPEARQLYEQGGHRSLAQVPLCSQGRVVGTLAIASKTPGPISEDDLSLLNAIGQQVGTAITNSQLRREALLSERMAAVGRVATSVAHDLRSPLGGIVRSAEFLGRPEISPATRQRLSQAVVSLAQRLIGTTQAILDYVRGGEMPLEPSPCSLKAFLDEALAVMEMDFSDRGIEVVRDLAYEGEIVVDARRMAQVVHNIAANARDAMPAGGTFTVAARKVGHRVQLRFRDTGPGVPEELRGRIFEPFVSLGKREGAGLGLAIARRIVQEHGGTLQLAQRRGHGAEFVVSLPL